MTDRRSSRSPIAKVTEAEIVGDASFRLPDGVVVNYSFSKIEQVTVDHMSISPEVMMVGIHQAEAEKQVAIARYAVPAIDRGHRIYASSARQGWPVTLSSPLSAKWRSALWMNSTILPSEDRRRGEMERPWEDGDRSRDDRGAGGGVLRAPWI